MAWAQWTVVVLMVIGLFMDLARAGKPRTGNHIDAVGAVIVFALISLLYWKAGMFTEVFK